MRKAVLIIMICALNNFYGQVIHRDKPRVLPIAQVDNSEIPEKVKDTSKYFHVGIIPYQFLSRSSGAYIGFDYKKCIIELRASYTRATNYLGVYLPFAYDNFYYQGLNISPVLSIKVSRKSRIGFMFIYRNWSYTDQWICKEGVSPSSSYSYTEKKSAYVEGIGVGFEYALDWSLKHFDFGFFNNISLTQMNGNMVISDGDYHAKSNPNNYYPKTDIIMITKAVFTFGLKFGYRKEIK